MIIKNRVGEKNYNKQNLLMEIIEYNKATDMVVQFENGYTCHCSYDNFIKGVVYNRYFPTVCDVGYIGDAYSSVNGKHKKSYKLWVNMINRCYNGRLKAYRECEVCDKWLCYENFEKWYDKNYYEINKEKMCLDKDILIKGNKIYSPKNCIFVPEKINTLFENCTSKNNNHSKGVCYIKEKQSYAVYCSNNGKTIYLGFLKQKKKHFYHIKDIKKII